jgi:hypothetical protein
MNRSALATMLFAMASASYGRSEASKPTVEPSLVTIRHVGEQDKPIWTLMVVSSARDVPPKTAWDLAQWFAVSRSVMSSLSDFIAEQGKSREADESPWWVTGTFEISWRTSVGSGKYVVPSEGACPYLADVQRLAKSDPTSGLAEAVRITRLRVGCSPKVP